MKTNFSAFLIVILIMVANSMHGQSSFKNPVLKGMNPDPSICRVGDDYYMVTSTFEYFPGLPVYHSKDLVHWKITGYALSRASNCPLMGCESATGGNYAPTIRYHDGRFYVACTNYGGQGSQGQFYVTAENPAGPWSDPIWVGNWYVDPSVSFVNDTMYYLTPNNNDGFLLGIMNSETGKYIKPLQKIALGTGGSSPEGPHLYKINNYYYLMSAEGGTGFQHMEVIQRSQSPWGPYEESPVNPVLSNKDVPDHPFQAIGHADLVQIQDGSWWAVCLGFRPKGGSYHHLGRETFLAPITWNEEGWPKAGINGIVEEEYLVPDLPQQIWDAAPIRDDFDTTELRLEWNFIRNPHAADWSLSERPGYLRLNGSGISFKEKDSPAFIGRRQSAFNMAASARISFTPVATNEEAGLIVRANDKNHYDLLITLHAGKRVAMLRRYLQDKVVSLSYKEISGENVILRITANELHYSFWVQEEGKTAVLIDAATTRDLSTEKTGGFTGTFIGMYASGNGTVNVNPADFDWFDYEEEPTLPYDWSIGSEDSLNHMITPRIISAVSSAYDEVTVIWNNIGNESYYIIERYSNDSFDSIGTTQAEDTVFTDSGLSGNTMYLYSITSANEHGYSHPSIVKSVVTLPQPGPFFGTPNQIPGLIEAENYDYGEKNVAFYDTDAGNKAGAYRNDDVEIETCWDNPQGYNIGWISNGEWVSYTVDINESPVDIKLRIAAENGGTIKLQLDGTEIAKTSIPATGGWQSWKTTTIPNVEMETGSERKLKVIFVTGGYNLNWLNFVKAVPSAIENINREGMHIFPNPAMDFFRINSKQDEFLTIEIYSITGEMVKSIHSYHNTMVDISTLDSGIYFLKVGFNNQETTHLKLVKN